MKRAHAAVNCFVAAIAVACSSAAPAPSGPCAARSGSFLYTLDARSGNCGQHAESLIVGDESSGTPPGCRGGTNTTADNCHVTVDLLDCPDEADGRGFRGDYKGAVTWSHDGSSGSGVIDITVYDSGGQAVCHGTYDARYQRQ